MYTPEEQEQIDALKAWWKQYGSFISTVIIAAALTILAFKGWEYYKTKQANEAAVLYAELKKATLTKDPKKIQQSATPLIEKYPSSPYAARAALTAAKTNVEQKDIKSAKNQLQWIIEHAKEESLQDIAQLRLASILLDEKQYDTALKQLEQQHTDSYGSLYAELKGDILQAKGSRAEARTAYQKALEGVDKENPRHEILGIKLDGLGASQS